MIKRIMLYLLLIIILIVSGCKANSEYVNDKGMYSAIDATNHKVEFQAKPKRIIALGVGLPEILIDIVGPNRVISITDFYDDETVSFVSEKAKKVHLKHSKVIPVEKILALKPDLVLVPLNAQPAKINNLREVGLKVVVVEHATGVESIMKNVQQVANAVGEKGTGEEIIANMKAIFHQIESINQNIPPAKRKKILAVSVEGAFGVKGGLFDDLCKHAFIENAAGNIELPKGARISKEAILKLQPDLLLVPSATRMITEDKRQDMIDNVLNDPAYMTLKAVKNKDIIALPDKYYRYCVSHYVAEAAFVLASKVYPEYYQDIHMHRLLPK